MDHKHRINEAPGGYEFSVDKPERITQNRVVRLFSHYLGYDYLGNLQDEPDNSNIEVTQLRKHLSNEGYSAEQVNKALDKLQTAANNHGQDLYHNNNINNLYNNKFYCNS